MGIEKKRYKMYKSGRNWLFAAITVLTIGAGGLLGGQTQASADVQTVTATVGQPSQSDQTSANPATQNVQGTDATQGNVTASDSAAGANNNSTNTATLQNDTTTTPVGVPATEATQWKSTAKVTLPTATSTTGDNTAEINTDQSVTKTSDSKLAVKDAGNFNLNYTITSSTDTPTKIYTDFLLPKFFDPSTTALVQNSFDMQALSKSQPNLNFTFSIKPGEYKSYDALKAAYPDVTASQLLAIYIQASALGKGESYTLSVPMSIANANEIDYKSAANNFEADVYNYNGSKGYQITDSQLNFQLLDPNAPTTEGQTTGGQTTPIDNNTPTSDTTTNTPSVTPTLPITAANDATTSTPNDQTTTSTDSDTSVPNQSGRDGQITGDQPNTVRNSSTTNNNGNQGSVTTSQNAGVVVNQKSANGSVQGTKTTDNSQGTSQLPQTNESTSRSATAASLGILGLLGLLGFAKRRKFN